ncbi:hypothetical protein FRC06_004403, partial [Ceratobasidium sp. 370]
MPALNILRLHAAQNGSSFSTGTSVSAATDSPIPTRRTPHLQRCEYCLRIIPFKSTRQHHIAATPKCRAAEWTKMHEERQQQKELRQTGSLDNLYAEAAEHLSGRSRTIAHTPEQAVDCAPEPVLERVQEPAVERARELEKPRPKRHRVTVETVPDEDGSPIVEPPTPVVPSTSAPTVSTPPTGGAPRAQANPTSNISSARVDPESGPFPSPQALGTQSGADRRARGGLRRWKGLYVEDFPDPLAGAPISEDLAPEPDLEGYLRSCGTLADIWNFEVAELLSTSHMTDEAKDRHLKSKLYEGQTPWPNVEVMNNDVDKLPHGPDFDLHDIDIFDGHQARAQFMVGRDIIQSIRHIFANPAFKEHFHTAPERHWLSPRKDQRMYSDMRSTNWWWREQEKMQGKGAVTIAPLIIATDQTQLATMSGGQKAYPMYMSTANVDNSVRLKQSNGAWVFVGLLPVDSFEDVDDPELRRRLKAELVHRAMEKILEPLKVASEEGVEMWCPDGRLRRVYPRIAAYLADWPEQNLHSCTSEGSCPVCSTDWGDRGSNEQPAPLRDREETLNAIRAYLAYRDVGELRGLKLKPVWPWWGDLPHVNLASCFTPDLLHQLYQGVFKSHL